MSSITKIGKVSLNSISSIQGTPVTSIAEMVNIIGETTMAGIESIQHVSILINSGSNAYADATISGVDLDKSFIIQSGHCGYESHPAYQQISVRLLNSTTVRAEREAVADWAGATTDAYVIEFSDGINSIQRGSVTFPTYGAGNQTVDTSINSVDLDKAIVVFSAHGSKHASGMFYTPRMYLSSATNLRGIRSGQYKDTITATVQYEVVEFS